MYNTSGCAIDLSNKNNEDNKCKHSPTRYYSWFAYNYKTGENDILCVGCCDCGEILAGAVTEEEIK